MPELVHIDHIVDFQILQRFCRAWNVPITIDYLTILQLSFVFQVFQFVVCCRFPVMVPHNVSHVLVTAAMIACNASFWTGATYSSYCTSAMPIVAAAFA